MSELNSLKGRIEGASGPDRDLDRDLHLALGLDLADVVHRGPWINLYTSSIDAVLALVERVLPGCEIRTILGQDHCYVSLHGGSFAERNTWARLSERRDRHLPLAILSALLTSLQHKDKSDA